MAVGSYGTIRPADVSPSDVEIFFHYVSGRTSTAPVQFKKLNSEDVLTPVYHNSDTTDSPNAPNTEILGGLYNLKLSSSDFDELGIYTLHIRPKQIRTSITDCGILASLPSVRGIIIDLSNVPSGDRNKFTPQGLTGYRIEYLNDDGTKIPNFYRVVTSSFYCTPIVSNLTSTSQKAIRYQYTDSITNLLYLTVTPSSAPTNRPNTVPFIGEPSQNIIFTNTFFNPTTIEVDMVEHDDTTLAYALYGNQSKSVSDGIYSIYDKSNNIYKQFNLFEIKDEFNETLYEIREKRDEIDDTKNFDDIQQ
jgi:hypothetical protein